MLSPVVNFLEAAVVASADELVDYLEEAAIDPEIPEVEIQMHSGCNIAGLVAVDATADSLGAADDD